jgi:hypothetical protein
MLYQQSEHSRRVLAGLVVLLVLVSLTVGADTARADQLVMDDADARVQVNGRWQASRATAGFYGDGYLFRVAGNGRTTVRWPFPAGTEPGRYAVLARWSSGPNRATAAPHQIMHAGGTTTMRVDQRAGGGRWHVLGTYAFRPGPVHGVALSDNADGVVIADAIAWVGPLARPDGVRLTDGADAQPLQQAVDDGDQPWLLDPLEVARADAVALGLSAGDPLELVNRQPGVARVRAGHAGATYDIHLIQPARLGPTGIWVVDSIRRAG